MAFVFNRKRYVRVVDCYIGEDTLHRLCLAVESNCFFCLGFAVAVMRFRIQLDRVEIFKEK